MSKALPPMMPPTASASAPRRTAASVVTSSGSDVTSAVSKAPIAVWLMPKVSETTAADSETTKPATPSSPVSPAKPSASIRLPGPPGPSSSSTSGEVSTVFTGFHIGRSRTMRGRGDADGVERHQRERDGVDGEEGDLRPLYARIGITSMRLSSAAWNMLASSAAECSRLVRRSVRSASARKAVCPAIPPTAFEKAREASPSIAEESETTSPDSDVAMPSSVAPITASPRPVRSAMRSASPVSLTPTSAITTADPASAASAAQTGRSVSTSNSSLADPPRKYLAIMAARGSCPEAPADQWHHR